MDEEARAALQRVAPELFAVYEATWGPAVGGSVVVHEATGSPVGVVLFVDPERPLLRLVTLGLARIADAAGHPFQLELLLAAHEDLGGASIPAVAEHLFDLAAHLVTVGVRPDPPMLMPPSDLSPFVASAVLFDEPLTEPEAVAGPEADGVHVHVVAVIPIHPEEYDHLDAADSLADAVDALGTRLGAAWTDVHRPPSPVTWLRPPR